MLPFNESALKALAEKVPDVHGKMKLFEVQAGRVAVHTGRVIARVSNFSPLDDGLYKFGSNDRAAGQLLTPWFLSYEEHEYDYAVRLPLPIVTRLYKALVTWLKARPKGSLIPHAQMQFTRIDETSFQLELTGQGSTSNPNLALDIEIELKDLDTYADRLFAYNAIEFADVLALFAKLKAEEGDVLLEYDKEPRIPVFFSVDTLGAHGHDILAGLPFVSPKKDETVTVSTPVEKNDYDDAKNEENDYPDGNDSKNDYEPDSNIVSFTGAGRG